MSTATRHRGPRLAATLRQSESVTPLELFFDLVFVLALTQCTQLMADEPTWTGLAKAMLVLAVLWWSWGGYAWLTSLVDPEEGAVRIVMPQGTEKIGRRILKGPQNLQIAGAVWLALGAILSFFGYVR